MWTVPPVLTPTGSPNPASAPSTRTGACAPVTATVAARRSRNRQPVRVISSPAAPGSLPTSRLAARSAGSSSAPDRGTPRWAYPGRPRSWMVVNGPAASTSSMAEPHSRARRQDGWRIRVDVEQRDRRAPDQQPAARGRGRVDPAVPAGQRDASRRYPRAWRVQPRYGKLRRQPGQVPEPRREPAERDPELGTGVPPDHLVDLYAPVPCDKRQVLAVVDRGYLHQPARRYGLPGGRVPAGEALGNR